MQKATVELKFIATVRKYKDLKCTRPIYPIRDHNLARFSFEIIEQELEQLKNGSNEKLVKNTTTAMLKQVKQDLKQKNKELIVALSSELLKQLRDSNE